MAISNEFHQCAIAGDRQAHHFRRYCLVLSAKLLVMAADDALKLFLPFLQILKCPAMILQGLLLRPLEGDASHEAWGDGGMVRPRKKRTDPRRSQVECRIEFGKLRAVTRRR